MEKALSFRSETDAVEEVIGMGRSKNVLRIENAFLSKDWFHSSKVQFPVPIKKRVSSRRRAIVGHIP
jgi:hypothetical protein